MIRESEGLNIDAILSLEKALHKFAKASSLCWHRHALRNYGCHIFRRLLEFEFEGHI